MPSTFPADLSFIGIAKEVTAGTFVASSAWMPVKKITFQPQQEYANVEVMVGSMGTDFQRIPTFGWGEIEIGGPVYADSIAWIAAGILGDVTDTGSSAPYTHAFSLKNSTDGQPTTHSVNDFYGAANRGIAGLKWTDLEITWTAEGILDYTAKGTGLSQAVQTKPTQSYTGILPMPAWVGALTVAGSAVSITSDGSIKLSRKFEIQKVMNGTQVPTEVLVTTLSVSGKYKALMQDDTELTRYLTNTQPTLNINFQQGASTLAQQLQFHCQIAAYDKPPKITQDPGKPVVIEAEWSALLNTTDAGASGGYSPVKCTIQNANASGLYQ